MKKLRIVFIILTIVWMITVFCFSHEPATKSSNTSASVIRGILNIAYGKSLSEEEIQIKIQELSPIIRKLAHFTLYTLGGMVIGTSVFTYNISLRKKILITQLIGSTYSITDELHQYFIPR